MTSYREAAIALWGEAGEYAHDSYARHHHLFPELPDELPIVCGITAYGKCLGLTRTDWTAGPRISIASNLYKAGTRRIDDVMVHEMLHAWLGVTGPTIKHDSSEWYAAVRRLSPAVLGHDVDVCRGGDRKSVREPNPRAGEPGQPATRVRKVRLNNMHGQVATWPYSFRPADYPRGRIIECISY